MGLDKVIMLQLQLEEVVKDIEYATFSRKMRKLLVQDRKIRRHAFQPVFRLPAKRSPSSSLKLN